MNFLTKPITRDQVSGWFSPLNLHIGAALLLAAVNIYLALHLLVLWSGRKDTNEDALANARSQQMMAEVAARPLRGLDDKLATAQKDADKFYATRLPYAYSDVAAELGALAKTNGVRLTRVQYLQRPSAHNVTEVRIDAALTGEYRPLATFLNGLERDKTFFLITAVGLTGQQSGQVNLRIQLATYLREPMPAVSAAPAEQGGAQ